MFRSPTSEELSRKLQNKKIKENSSLSYILQLILSMFHLSIFWQLSSSLRWFVHSMYSMVQLCSYSYLRVVLQVDDLVQGLVVVVVVVPMPGHGGETQGLKMVWLLVVG